MRANKLPKINVDVEYLLSTADMVMKPHNRLVMVDEDKPGEFNLGFVAMAIRFHNRPDLVLRAVVEDWDRYRIFRELN